jgi:hypothetical protein
MSKRRGDSGGAICELAEVASRERPVFQQVEQECVHVRTHGLHGIECERIAVALIGMEYADLWVAAMCEQCER